MIQVTFGIDFAKGENFYYEWETDRFDMVRETWLRESMEIVYYPITERNPEFTYTSHRTNNVKSIYARNPFQLVAINDKANTKAVLELILSIFKKVFKGRKLLKINPENIKLEPVFYTRYQSVKDSIRFVSVYDKKTKQPLDDEDFELLNKFFEYVGAFNRGNIFGYDYFQESYDKTKIQPSEEFFADVRVSKGNIYAQPVITNAKNVQLESWRAASGTYESTDISDKIINQTLGFDVFWKSNYWNDSFLLNGQQSKAPLNNGIYQLTKSSPYYDFGYRFAKVKIHKIGGASRSRWKSYGEAELGDGNYSIDVYFMTYTPPFLYYRKSYKAENPKDCNPKNPQISSGFDWYHNFNGISETVFRKNFIPISESVQTGLEKISGGKYDDRGQATTQSGFYLYLNKLKSNSDSYKGLSQNDLTEGKRYNISLFKSRFSPNDSTDGASPVFTQIAYNKNGFFTIPKFDFNDESGMVNYWGTRKAKIELDKKEYVPMVSAKRAITLANSSNYLSFESQTGLAINDSENGAGSSFVGKLLRTYNSLIKEYDLTWPDLYEHNVDNRNLFRIMPRNGFGEEDQFEMDKLIEDIVDKCLFSKIYSTEYYEYDGDIKKQISQAFYRALGGTPDFAWEIKWADGMQVEFSTNDWLNYSANLGLIFDDQLSDIRNGYLTNLRTTFQLFLSSKLSDKIMGSVSLPVDEEKDFEAFEFTQEQQNLYQTAFDQKAYPNFNRWFDLIEEKKKIPLKFIKFDWIEGDDENGKKIERTEWKSMSELEDALKQQWDYSVNDEYLKFKFSFEWEDGKQMGPFRGYLVANDKRNTDRNNYKAGTSFSEWLENFAILNDFKQPEEYIQYRFDFGVKVKAAEKTDIATFISDLEMLYEDVPSDELKQYIEDLKLLLE